MKKNDFVNPFSAVALRNRLMRGYFILDCTIGTFANEKELFEALANKVFCITDPRIIAEIYASVSDDNVVSIKTKTEHETAMRAIKYSKVHGGIPIVLSDAVASAVACKGKALEKAEKLRSELVGCADIGEAISTLEKRANSFSTTAMFILGFAYCELLGDKCDVAKGLKYLEKCARWNYVEATLAVLSYGDDDKKREFLPIFKAQIEGLFDEKELSAFLINYGGDAVIADPVARLVRQYIENTEREDEALYDPRIVDVAASPYLSEHDKKRCVKQGADEQLVGIVSEYALSKVTLCINEGVEFKDFVSAARAPEAAYIGSYLIKSVQKALKRRLLLVCSDEFILEAYLSALSAKLADFKVITVDLTGLDKTAFLPLKGNVLVSKQVNCNAASVVFILKNADRLESEAASELCKMLDAAKDKSFMLQDLGITLDLSGDTFIFAAKTENVVRGLTSRCHPFYVAKADESERLEYIEKALHDWCVPYFGDIPVSIDKAAAKLLATKDLEIAQSIVERVCMNVNVNGINEYAIKVEDVEKVEKLVSSSDGLGFRLR